MEHNITVIVGICSFVIGVVVEGFRQYIKKNKRTWKTYNKFCTENCQYLNPTEAGQTDEKEPHYCDKYSERLFHRGNHPKIVKCRECRNKR